MTTITEAISQVDGGTRYVVAVGRQTVLVDVERDGSMSSDISGHRGRNWRATCNRAMAAVREAIEEDSRSMHDWPCLWLAPRAHP